MADEKPKLRVLVVDDELAIGMTLVAVLNQGGYDATTVGDGLAAVELARSFRPDMLITNVFLSDIDGVETAIRIREFLPSTRILLMSTRAGMNCLTDLPDSARAQGHEFEFVAMPFEPSFLLHWCSVDGKHDARSCSSCRPRVAAAARAWASTVDPTGDAQPVPPADCSG